MIDYHCHLLPGLDDGPETADESLDMARALATFGFREVCCTPHCIKGHYETSPVEVREAVRKLQSRLDYEGVALTLRAGMEYYLDEFFEPYAANLLPLGDSRLVLCEAPPQAPPGLVSDMVGLIVVQGFIPLIAHPERSDVILEMLEEETRGEKREQAEAGSEKPEAGSEKRERATSLWRRLFSFRDSRPTKLFADDASPLTPHPSRFTAHAAELPEQCLFQANLGSFTGYYGPKPQRRAYELLQHGVYSCLASDLHDPRAAAFLQLASEKLEFNPALRKLGQFKAPQGQGGSDQLAFW
jgi:protein-tyrosine phosphatase